MSQKVDGDTLVQVAAAATGQIQGGEHGIMFLPYHKRVVRRYIGSVKTPAGVYAPVKFFYRTEDWQVDYAEKLVSKLNYDLHHDGAWSVLWTEPTADGVPTHMKIAYQDVDGDVQFVIDVERTIADMQATGPESHLSVCEQAWQRTCGWKKDVDIKLENTIKAAQGQRPFDPKVQPII